MALTISAGNLGHYASSRFCPRCAWVRLHVKSLPFQTFPGIFSSIDRYNKLIVHSHFEREHSPPSWLKQLGASETYVSPPHWRKYSIVDPDTGTTLRGEADGIFRMTDGSYTIVDYKTARHTPGQLGLFQHYEVQLNAYAYIGERLDFRPVRKLALVYMEPQTDEGTARRPQLIDNEGFSMGFRATVVPVTVKPDELIPPLLEGATRINEMDEPPVGSQGCDDCEALDGLMRALG